MPETFEEQLARIRDLAVGGGSALMFRHTAGGCDLSPDTKEDLAELLRRWDALVAVARRLSDINDEILDVAARRPVILPQYVPWYPDREDTPTIEHGAVVRHPKV